MSWSEKPKSDNRAKPYPVSSLRLDNLNPRLPSRVKDYSQTALLMYMEKHYNLLPIARSMSDNGYFDEEPVVIIPKEGESETYIVIEGNRRLAALRFLTDPELRAKSAYKEIYDELAESAVENLLEIPAVLYQNRNETDAMLGFRHITGIMKWSPFLKAEYVHEFVENHRGMTFQQLARMLGDRTSRTRRDYATYCIYLQAKKEGIDVSNLVQEFSIFYTALGRLSMQEFIGIQIRGSSIEEWINPIPVDKVQNLKELIEWIHGTEDAKPVIKESRELKLLAEILQSKTALQNLREGRKLDEAHSLTISEEVAIVTSLNIASYNIEDSLKYIHRHKDDPKINRALYRCTDSLVQALRYFPDVTTELGISISGEGSK